MEGIPEIERVRQAGLLLTIEADGDAGRPALAAAAAEFREASRGYPAWPLSLQAKAAAVQERLLGRGDVAAAVGRLADAEAGRLRSALAGFVAHAERLSEPRSPSGGRPGRHGDAATSERVVSRIHSVPASAESSPRSPAAVG